MESPQSQQLQKVNEKNNDYLFVKVVQLFSKEGFEILDEHKELVRRFPETKSDGSAEAKTDSQEKSSLSISGAGHNKHVDILHIAAAYVNKKGFWGRTPLYLAAGTEDTELVDLFLKAGADVGAEDMFSSTPIHYSAFNGSINIVEGLLKAGANVNAEDKDKQTPLHLSAANGNKEVIEMLLKVGANINAEDECKQTPLHLSAANENKEVVEVLLKAGANINAEDNFKQTTLHLSAANGNKEVVEMLLKAGANGNAADFIKQTPLHISAEKKHNDICELLLRADASVYERDKRGRSVLDYMDDRQRIRFGLEPRKLFKLRNWMYSITKSKKHVESSTSSKTKTEHTETISATFTDFDTRRYGEIHTFPNEDSSKENGQVDKTWGSTTSLTTGPQLGRSTVTSSCADLLSSPPPPSESHDLDDSDLQELKSIRQQVKNHWAKFSPETTEGCQTSCSHKVKTALQAGRVKISATTNITLNKITNKITKDIKIFNHHYEPGASLNIGYAENVALGSQTVVQSKKVKSEDDDDDSFGGDDEHDSFSEEDNNNTF